MPDIMDAIATVGFPIAMSLMLFVYLQKETETHRAEQESLKEAITELKIAIVTLTNKMERKEE